MTSRDLVLNARIAGLMEQELSRLGHGISEQPETAYWALAILASNSGHSQFALTATLELRNMTEGQSSGFVRYPGQAQATAPTVYTALLHGSRRELLQMVREYVHRANTALLSTSQALCTYEAHEEDREREMERQLRESAGEPVPPMPQDPSMPPLNDLGQTPGSGQEPVPPARQNSWMPPLSDLELN
jgi:hypothetical protein